MKIRLFILATGASSLLAAMPAASNPSPSIPPLLQNQPAAPISHFEYLLSSIRNATPQSAAAKADARELFIQLYNEGDDNVKEVLGTLTLSFSKIFAKRWTRSSTKERAVLLTLTLAEQELTSLLTQQAPISAKPAALTKAIYTAMNPVLGDSWRMVRKGALWASGAISLLLVGKMLFGKSSFSEMVRMAGELTPESRQALVNTISQPRPPQEPAGPRPEAFEEIVMKQLLEWRRDPSEESQKCATSLEWFMAKSMKIKLNKVFGDLHDHPLHS